MPANRRRGEVAWTIDGQERVLCLTLGALAELEDAFAAESLPALARRFSTGDLKAADLTRIIGAGLRGAGVEATDAAVTQMRVEGGAAGAAELAASLLSAAFETPGSATPDP